MPETVSKRVARATRIESRFIAHAAHQAMSAYLDDWEEAYLLLGRKIGDLRTLRDRRLQETAEGRWPYG